MDSFFSLFDPSDGHQNKNKKKHQNKELDNVKKKADAPKGRRRGRKATGKNETLPEESSFLCEPHLSSELLVKDHSYIECYIEVNKELGKEEETKTDEKKPKRRNSGRKNRRWKKSPPKEEGVEQTDTQTTLWNNRSSVSKICTDVGKNVNDLNDYKKNRRKEFGDGELHNVIDKLEKVILKDDTYLAGDFNADDLDNDAWCSSDDLEESLDDTASEAEGSSDEAYGSLPPEPRFGNVEYKLQLVSPCERRFQHLVTQLKWRLRSGGGSAVYLLGVRDCGALRGLRARALRGSLHTLRRMAAALQATLSHVTARRVAQQRAVAEVYIRKLADTQQSVELRVAVMGANEAGKSTLIGVLTQGELDNGRGSARLNMFRHLHEVKSGRTSSLSHEILGFDAQGNVVNYGCSELMTAERIGERSAKLVSFLDLAGHSKYQRTTLHGLTGYSPHYAMLVISATAGITRITEEHIGLLLALDLPFFAVVSKCELAPAALPSLLRGLEDILRQADKKPLLITDENLARNCVGPQKLILDTIDGIHDAEQKDDESGAAQVPVFPVSCVRGAGLAALHAYLLALQPPPQPQADAQPDHESCEFQVDEIFHVGGAGPVVGGLLAAGRLREGDRLIIGPLDTGEFVPTVVKTIYRNRVPCGCVRAGHSASLGLARAPPRLRPGMVLLAQRTKDKQPKHEKHKEKNLYNTIANMENSLAKPADDNPDNIYNSNDNADNIYNSNDNADNIYNSNDNADNIYNSNDNADNIYNSNDNADNIYNSNDNADNIYNSNDNADNIYNSNDNADNIYNSNDNADNIYNSNDNADNIYNSNDNADNIYNSNDNADNIYNSNDNADNIYNSNDNADNIYNSNDNADNIYNSNDNADNIYNSNDNADNIYNSNDNADNIYNSNDKTDNMYNANSGHSTYCTANDRAEGEDKHWGCECCDRVLLEDPDDPRGCIYFQASIHVLRHSTAISPGFQCTVHCGNVRQTAIIEGIMSHNSALRCGESAPALFRFARCPEYLVRGRRLLLAAGGGTRAIGRVTQIFPYVP